MTGNKELLQLYPIPANSSCPVCHNKEAKSKDYNFMGMHWLCKVDCNNCNSKGLHWHLPFGHFKVYSSALKKNERYTPMSTVPEWLLNPLIKNLDQKSGIQANIERIGTIGTREAVLLNCLDSCYGHALWRLFNVDLHLDKNKIGLIVIIPRSMRWLVPDKVEEIWQVDIAFHEANKVIAGFDVFIKNEMKRFEKTWLSPAMPHLDHSKIYLDQYFKTPKYDLDLFEQLPLQLTFILREDRFWLSSRFDEMLFFAAVKFRSLNIFRSYFVRRQNHKFGKVASILKSEFDNIRIVATGLGISAKLSRLIEDNRVEIIDEEKEREWCQLYGMSFLVVGVHGSGMMIPTALSGGFIEILPRFKITNMTEDILNNSKGRMAYFLGRHLPDFVKPREVAKHIITMIREFSRNKNELDAEQNKL